MYPPVMSAANALIMWAANGSASGFMFINSAGFVLSMITELGATVTVNFK